MYLQNGDTVAWGGEGGAQVTLLSEEPVKE